MKNSVRTGVSFGLTSAVITTLGLMVGLHSGTHSKMIVLSGIFTIAIADAFSDGLGIHISKEVAFYSGSALCASRCLGRPGQPRVPQWPRDERKPNGGGGLACATGPLG